MASQYWEDRAELRQLSYDRANNKVVADVSRVYDRTMRQLNEDIDSIIGTYTRKTGLTAKEAQDFLNSGVPPGVMDELRSRVAVITDPRQRKKLQVMLSTDAYRARISRLDAIKASTRVGLTEAAEAELGAITPHLKGMIESGYSRTLYDIQKVSYGFAGAGVPRSALDMILKSKWSGEHYSSRIWGNRDAMSQILNRALMEQSTMGKLSDLTMQDVRGMVNLDKWRSQVTSKFKEEWQYQKYAANRLIRTESAYVAGQATAVAYDECEIDKYEFIAVLDRRTSSVCQGLDGKFFDTKDKEVGVNWNPMHPHCRSATAPVLDTQNRKAMQRRGEGKDGRSVVLPADMNYNEWKAWQDAGCPDVAEWRNKQPMTLESRKEIYDSFRDKLTTSGFSNESIERLSKSLEGVSDDKLQLIGRTIGDVNLYEIENAKSHYNYGRNIYIEKPIRTSGESDVDFALRLKTANGTFLHEYGHYIDDRFGIGLNVDVVAQSRSGADKFLRSIQGEKYRFDGKNIIRASDDMIVGLDKTLDTEATLQLQRDISEHLNNSLGIKSQFTLLKEAGCPDKPNYEDFIETYITPKRRIVRSRERYEGAREEYNRQNAKYYDLFDEWYKENPNAYAEIDKILEKQKETANMASYFTDSIDSATSGQMGMFFEWGGHTPQYFRQGYGELESKEIVANVFYSDASRNKVANKLFDEYLPNVKQSILDEIKRKTAP